MSAHGAAGEQPLVSGGSVLLGNPAQVLPCTWYPLDSCHPEMQREMPHASQVVQQLGSFLMLIHTHSSSLEIKDVRKPPGREAPSSEFPDLLSTAPHCRGPSPPGQRHSEWIGREEPRTAGRNWGVSAQSGLAVDAAVGGPGSLPQGWGQFKLVSGHEGKSGDVHQHFKSIFLVARGPHLGIFLRYTCRRQHRHEAMRCTVTPKIGHNPSVPQEGAA